MPRHLAALAATLITVAITTPLLGASAAHAAPVTFASTAVNTNGGNCMDVPNSQSGNGVQLVQYGCNSGANQNYTFVPVAGTTDQYNIRTLTSGKCIDVYGVSTADNAAIIQWTCHTGDPARRRRDHVGTGVPSAQRT